MKGAATEDGVRQHGANGGYITTQGCVRLLLPHVVTHKHT